MIAALDIETQGLDATKYVMGCLWLETNQKPEIYMDKNKLWQRIITIARQQRKNGKTLNIYSHNAQYDTASYVPLTSKGLKIFSNQPFIWTYTENNKEIIKFLDTMSLYRMSLAKTAQLIGMKKTETPNSLKTGKKLTTQQTQNAIPYLKKQGIQKNHKNYYSKQSQDTYYIYGMIYNTKNLITKIKRTIKNPKKAMTSIILNAAWTLKKQQET